MGDYFFGWPLCKSSAGRRQADRLSPPPSFGFDLTVRSLFLHRITGIHPFFPAALEGINITVTLCHQFLCHPDTGVFVRSGTIEYDCIIFRVDIRPIAEFLGVAANGSRDFLIAAGPIAASPNIKNDGVRFVEPGFQFIRGHQGNLLGVHRSQGAGPDDNRNCRNEDRLTQSVFHDVSFLLETQGKRFKVEHVTRLQASSWIEEETVKLWWKMPNPKEQKKSQRPKV
jgi:hypothetical protein